MANQKVALVTGVSSGIGLATAKKLIGRGFHTFGTIRETSQPRNLAAGLEIVRLDVRDDESVRTGVQEVLDRAGRIDALINNAGTVLFGSLEETSVDEATDLFETNFFGVLRMCQAVLPIMRRQKSGRNFCRRPTWENPGSIRRSVELPRELYTGPLGFSLST